MRYKFRAYNIETKTMILLDPLQWPLKVLDEEENWKVMMWSGLLDRHRKEIYEGDIIESVSNMVTIGTGRNTGEIARQRYEVVWDKDSALFAQKNSHGYVQVGTGMKQRFMTEYYTVIGNIWENPELLSS